MLTKPVLSHDDAKAAVDAAIAEATRRGLKISLAVVDEAGHLLHFERMDGCRLCAIDAAIAKARTCAFYRRPTKAYADALRRGEPMLTTLPNMTPVEGGKPLYAAGASVGAIGVSGANGEDDDAVADVAVALVAAL